MGTDKRDDKIDDEVEAHSIPWNVNETVVEDDDAEVEVSGVQDESSELQEER